MPAKRRTAKARTGGDLTDLEWDYLNDAIAPDDPRRTDPATRWRFYELDCNTTLWKMGRPILTELWTEHGPAVLAEWRKEHPGTRPSCWWRIEAPKGVHASGFDGHYADPRRRVGGSGRDAADVLAVCPAFMFGLPREMVKVDPTNPPTFESEAAYLDRHGLLTAVERRRLSPANFDPVARNLIIPQED